MGTKVDKRDGDRPNEKGERYLKGRTEGVEGTYGMSRGPRNSAEKTVPPKDDMHDSGAAEGIPQAASSMYRKAVRNEGDSIGDKALTER